MLYLRVGEVNGRTITLYSVAIPAIKERPIRRLMLMELITMTGPHGSGKEKRYHAEYKEKVVATATPKNKHLLEEYVEENNKNIKRYNKPKKKVR